MPKFTQKRGKTPTYSMALNSVLKGNELNLLVDKLQGSNNKLGNLNSSSRHKDLLGVSYKQNSTARLIDNRTPKSTNEVDISLKNQAKQANKSALVIE